MVLCAALTHQKPDTAKKGNEPFESLRGFASEPFENLRGFAS